MKNTVADDTWAMPSEAQAFGRRRRHLPFKENDLVRVAADLGYGMSHFTADCDAIVIKCNGDRTRYTLHIQGKGEVSWYDEDQLELISRDAGAVLLKWQAEEEAERLKKSDLNWIFSNGEEVLALCPNASIEALAKSFCMTNLWPSGEGAEYVINSLRTLDFARPFLESGDKAGYLAKCVEVTRLSQTDADCAGA